MSAWSRRAAIALLALALAAGGAAAWLHHRFDPADPRNIATAWMKSRYDRALEIDGPIRLSLFPRLQIRFADVSLSEPGRGERFASFDELALSVGLLPLLRGRLEVDRIEAQGLRLVLQRDAEGRRNIDDLLRTDPNDAGGGAPGALRFDVSRILLRDVQARVKDERDGIDGELVVKELATGRIATGVESALSLVAQFGFKTPGVKGELSGSTRFTPDFATRSLTLSDMNLAYKGDATGASSIDALLKGRLAWDGTKRALGAEALSLRLTANTAGLRLVGSTLSVERFTLEPGLRAFGLSQLQLRIKGNRAGSPVALDVDWPELDVAGDKLAGSALSGKVAFGTELPLTITFRGGAPSGNFDQVRVPGFEARIASAAASRKIGGSLRSELVLQPASSSVSLDKMDLRLRIDEPGWRSLSLALTGNADAGAGNARWRVAGDVNRNTFDSEGTASLAGITPNVKTSLRFQALDLNALLDGEGGGAAGDANAPFSLDALRSVNGTLSLRIGTLALRHYRIADVGLDATLDAGMLRIASFKGHTWGGLVDGSAFADARASRLALRAAADGVSIAAMLKDIADQDALIDGRGRVDVEIETAGRGYAELKSRLKGNATLQLRDGGVKGVNLGKGLRQARTALPARQDALVKPNRAERTDFSELSASFQVQSGVARSTDLDLRSPSLRLEGDGMLDIVKSRIDGTLRGTVSDAPPRGPEATELAALRGVTVPVHLNGPLDAVNWKIQWSGAVGAPPPPRAGAPEPRAKEARARKPQKEAPKEPQKGPLP